MKRWICVLVLCAAAFAQDGNVTITWVGQACFVVKSDGGPMVVTDPPAASVGFTIPALSADVVTVSHNHGDHNFTAGVGGRFALVDGRPVTARQEMTAAGLPFVLIPGFHDNAGGTVRGTSFGLSSLHADMPNSAAAANNPRIIRMIAFPHRPRLSVRLHPR